LATTAEHVLQVMDRLAEGGLAVWLDGGWGVDSLLGEQTREHDDLDLVLALDASDAATGVLATLGYRPSEDERPTRLVLRDGDGRQIDIHTVIFDDGGGGVQKLPGGRSYRYPPAGFTGRGEVAGRPVPCMTAEVQIACHLGYPPTDKDRRDVAALARRFALPMPPGY
jgi:lincosamide nucleotidyltransferase A/C/D/E